MKIYQDQNFDIHNQNISDYLRFCFQSDTKIFRKRILSWRYWIRFGSVIESLHDVSCNITHFLIKHEYTFQENT